MKITTVMFHSNQKIIVIIRSRSKYLPNYVIRSDLHVKTNCM
jgi:DNA recombination-dependent growth factor C